jgi:predicted nucleic acid-binding protein
MPNKPVIINNTPLVALAALERLDILRNLYHEVLMPQAVYEEFIATDTANRLAILATMPWLKTVALRQPENIPYTDNLDRGEAEVLALAAETSARLLIIDERKGRRYAQQMGYIVTGTLGILLLAKKKGLIEKVAPFIRTLQQAGLYLAPKLVNEALILANEI